MKSTFLKVSALFTGARFIIKDGIIIITNMHTNVVFKLLEPVFAYALLHLLIELSAGWTVHIIKDTLPIDHPVHLVLADIALQVEHVAYLIFLFADPNKVDDHELKYTHQETKENE